MKVFIPEVICEETHGLFKPVAEVKVGRKDGRYTEGELIREVEDVDAILTTSRNRFTARVIESARKLKVIAKYGARPDNIDIEAATKKGIIVTWTPHTNDDSVAEHAITFMLALNKKLVSMMAYLKRGQWRARTTTITNEMLGKTIGIIGLGSIGYKVAEKLRGFDVKILAYDPYVPEERVEEVGAKMVDFDTLLRESDFVTVHATLTENTRGMIGEEELKKMKKSSFIINTSRGPLIDEDSLIKALKNKWIAGAALDVFTKEPPSPDNPLLKMDDVLFSPHIAAWTEESLRKQALMATEDVIRFLKGQRPRHVLNPEVLSAAKTVD
ncbi:MAG: hydroxyacid dehydrogenase [Candidatus Bathyarchaeota archaeon]|nr:hydroxyacid dehydrogenase [Candidatus Bathyarchaeota archaeon]